MVAASPTGAAATTDVVAMSLSNSYMAAEEGETTTEILALWRENTEKAKISFNSLRDIPPHGHEAWKMQFGKAFELHNFVWKYQQKHRQVLTDRAGLKRWEIGEIASKIGQLYYQYYIRCADTEFLNESFIFYSSARLRNYYKNVENEATSTLMIKKLRFYTRFLVVILLLGKFQLLQEVMKELFHFVAQFSSIYSEEAQEEWALVCSELQTFYQKFSFVKIIATTPHPGAMHIEPKLRLSSDNIPQAPDDNIPRLLTIGRVIITGNDVGQVKFNDLSMDMYRIMMCFELEPDPKNEKSGKLVVDKLSNNKTRALAHPPKHLLYQPSVALMMSYIGNSFKEINDDSVLVLYLSGEGVPSTDDDEPAYGCGGVSTNRRHGSYPNNNHGAHLNGHVKHGNMRKSHAKDSNCIYPGDLYSFTRKPLFLIVDSSNSMPFLSIPNVFGEPFMALVSPQSLPTALEDSLENAGGLFTLFLSNPVFGFCKICGLEDISEKSNIACHVIIKSFYHEAAKFISRCKNVDLPISLFCGDVFLRLILLKFLFCSYTLRLHRSFKNWTMWPRCHPEFPIELMDNLVLEKMIRDISIELDVQTLFNDSVRV